jgi:hypothetical protein
MSVSLPGRPLGAVCLLSLLVLWGCRRENPSTFDSNLPPETIISGAPAESTLSFYQVHVYWYGNDPDGFVDHYEYAVTDTNKAPGDDTPGFSGFYRTTVTDSVFKMSANLPQILGHRFYVRAIDNQGKMDPTPAWTYFVAHDFNFPDVVFHTSQARWIDRSGNLRTFPLTSTTRGAPTDTVGMGAEVEFSWGGFDVDPGGFITGYEYRSSKDDEFQGGTLADTTFSLSFARPAGSAISSYFSGNELVQVRAIDDAGAKTNPDSARSFVVGFSPLTWILDPTQGGTPVRKKVFSDRDTELVWPSGTTLADDPNGRNVRFQYTGFDDPRDQSLNPNNPSGIIGFEYRRLLNGGGLAYQKLPGWNPYPVPSEFSLGNLPGQPGSSELKSGDYLFLVRSVDEMGRKGRPDTLAVNVNYAPYYAWVRYVGQDGMEHPLWNPGGSLVTVDIDSVAGSYPDLQVRYFARDTHFPPPDTDPLDPNIVVETELSSVKDYLARLNGSRTGFEAAPIDTAGGRGPGETFFEVDPNTATGKVRPGENELLLRVRDVSNRVGELKIKFLVNLN